MRKYFILLSLLAAFALGMLVITCSNATNPEKTIATNYKRDYDYLERTFFWLFGPEDSVTNIIDGKIYVFQQKDSPVETDIIAHDAQIAVDPANYGQFPEEDQTTSVKELATDTYNIYNDNLYLEMLTYDRNRMIAGWFEVETTSGDTIEVGNIDNDTLLLKLISLDQIASRPNCQTFRNEWRNVYSVGNRDVNPQKLRIQIHLGEPGTETIVGRNPDNQDGTKFITLLGIDRMDEHYAQSPDGKADLFDSTIFWPDKGYLFFPIQRPFDPENTYHDIPLETTVPDIYENPRSTITGNPTRYTKYYFEFRCIE